MFRLLGLEGPTYGSWVERGCGPLGGSVGGWEEWDTWVGLREGDVGALKEARSVGREWGGASR